MLQRPVAILELHHLRSMGDDLQRSVLAHMQLIEAHCKLDHPRGGLMIRNSGVLHDQPRVCAKRM